MSELVLKNSTGKDVTSSLIVAEIFGKNHFDVLRDIRNLHCSDDFRVSNFALLVEMRKLPQGGATKAEYYEITKDGFSFLVMGYTGEKAAEFKEKFINEFNKRESLLKNDDYILARSQEILNGRVKMLEQQVHQTTERLKLQETVIKESAPKVEYFDKVLQSKGLIPINIIANELGMSGQKLNKLLKEQKIQYKVDDTWVLYAQYRDKGYVQNETHYYLDKEGNNRTVQHMYWKEKGREFIHRVIESLRKVA